VTPGGSGDGDWWSVAWIGIDGWGSGDVLQAGTGHHVSRTNGVVTENYFTWYEWFPNNWVEISNIPVVPGDAISVMVRYLGITNGIGQGLATLTNLTTGISGTVNFSAPAGTTLQGDSAEWIMERPKINGNLVDLPEYGHITFSGCQTNSVPGSSAQPVNMTDSAGTIMSSAELESDWDCSFVAGS
jgi:hypothetical protein